jgi:hypothetical protein
MSNICWMTLYDTQGIGSNRGPVGCVSPLGIMTRHGRVTPRSERTGDRTGPSSLWRVRPPRTDSTIDRPRTPCALHIRLYTFLDQFQAVKVRYRVVDLGCRASRLGQSCRSLNSQVYPLNVETKLHDGSHSHVLQE